MSSLSDWLNRVLAPRYALDRELGRGSMGVVFAGRDVERDRPVALKVLRPEVAVSVARDRWSRALALLRRLDHPNVLPVIDEGDVGGLPFAVMPLVEGESLAKRLEREGALSIDAAVHIGRCVAAALQHAHEHEIVHRDVKPANVLLPGDHVWVTDFGIARVFDDETEITATGALVGTPAYMSPEQAGGLAEVDARSDVYGLGCVLFEMLAGEPPFGGVGAQALVAQHMNEPPPPVRTVRPEVPDALDEALARCLAKRPDDRFQSAGAFGRFLETVAGDLAASGR